MASSNVDLDLWKAAGCPRVSMSFAHWVVLYIRVPFKLSRVPFIAVPYLSVKMAPTDEH